MNRFRSKIPSVNEPLIDNTEEKKAEDAKKKAVARRAGHGKERVGTLLELQSDSIFSLHFISNFKRIYVKAALLAS